MEIDPEVMEHIKWLKVYAKQNKLSWEALVTHEPIPKEYFIQLSEEIILGYSVEESKLVLDGMSPEFGTSFYLRHLSINFDRVKIKDIDSIVLFCLANFEFDPNVHIGTWDQISEYDSNRELRHFIQEII